nr:hypothetical protein [Tanacetum cinerariifolium]
KEETYQITLEALKLSPCYLAFMITAKVPEIYMHQFWNTVKKIGKSYAYDFKLDKKKRRVDTEKEETYQITLEALKLSPCYPAFLITAKVLEIYMHQFWNTVKKIGKSYAYDFKLDKKKRRVDTERTFAAIINMCISWKTTGLDRLRESRAQIFLSGTIKFVAKTKDCQKYGALIPDGMINQNVKDSKTYKTYYNFATGKVEPKKARKFNKRAFPRLKTIPSSPKEHTQRIGPAKAEREKGIELLLDVSLLEETQMKKYLKKSRQETHKLQTIGSNKGADFELEFHDESMGKPKDTSEGTGMKLGVLDMSKEDSSYSEVESWGDSKEESDDDNVKDKNDDDNEEDSSDNDDGGNDDEDYEDEKQYEEFVLTPERNTSDDDDNMYEEEDDDVAKELYGDLNIT